MNLTQYFQIEREFQSAQCRYCKTDLKSSITESLQEQRFQKISGLQRNTKLFQSEDENIFGIIPGGNISCLDEAYHSFGDETQYLFVQPRVANRSSQEFVKAYKTYSRQCNIFGTIYGSLGFFTFGLGLIPLSLLEKKLKKKSKQKFLEFNSVFGRDALEALVNHQGVPL